nr:phospholipase-like protein [Tanacetum cinerariifolium]
MSSVEDVIIPIEQSNAITPIEELNASNHILTNLTDPSEDALKREVDFKSKEDTLKFDISGHTLELGRIEFSLLTGFSIGKVSFPKVKAGDIPPLVRRLFPEKVPRKYKRPKGVSYNVKGLELLDFVKDDDKWKNISDVDAVRVCLLLMAKHVFMGQETNHVMGKPIMMLAENLIAWDNLPWGEYFWTEFYGRTVNLVLKNRKKYLQKLKTDPLSKASYFINGLAWVLKANLDKGVSSGADAGESSREETVKEDKHSRRELEFKRLLRQVERRLHTLEMESTKLKEEFAYLRKENDAPHEKALNVPQDNQELSYAADDLHTMALDEDEKVCTDEPKPSTTLHSFIQADGVQFMALDKDAKVCIYEEPKPSTTLHSDIPADDVCSIPFDDDAKDTRVEYMNEELCNRSQNKEPLSKQPYVPFHMHTRSRDYQPLDKQPEDKLKWVPLLLMIAFGVLNRENNDFKNLTTTLASLVGSALALTHFESTPVATESKLGPDGDPVSDPTLYRSLAGSFQYLTFTRPDISYAVQHVCLFMHDPREPHFSALKRILCYV